MPDVKNRRLGRGFDALLPRNFDSSLLLDDADKIQKIDVTKIQPNKQQPRTHFDEEALSQLADSIKQYGVLQPLVVTSLSKGSYGIIAGERRWRAAQLAGLAKVPVIVRSSKELEQLEIALVENVQRVDLSPLEQAVSIERLHQQFSMSYEGIAKRLGKAPSTINNIVRLLQLPRGEASSAKPHNYRRPCPDNFGFEAFAREASRITGDDYQARLVGPPSRALRYQPQRRRH